MKDLTGNHFQLLLLIYLFQWLLTACAPPSAKFNDIASELGYKQLEIDGSLSPHVLFHPVSQPEGDTLHVYLDGDGSPWKNYTRISPDPTPRDPLVLQLMSIDPDARIYLGRPCYHGSSASQNCTSYHWTNGRYSESVISSMEHALRQYLRTVNNPKIVLIGYSGGGTIAMLLAPRFNNTLAVVTIAGNLDIDTWAEYHHYSPLKGSINPSEMEPLTSEILQLHLTGKLDSTVPAELIKKAIAKEKNARLRVLDTFTHSCCWQEIWPEILREVYK